MAYDPSAARSGSVFSTNPFYQGAWLCYINKIAVPIQGFTVTSGVWTIPQFQIQVVPDVTLMRLGNEDLVEVAIFYLDHWIEPGKPTWCLVADGEIIGWQFQNTPNGRVMSFDCLAHIHVFQQLYFYFMSNVDDVVAAQDPSLRASGFATQGLSYPYSLFHKGLLVSEGEATALNNRDTTAPPNTEELIKAPYEFVYNVIRGTIGKEVPNERRALPMMNFFARHTRQTQFHNRWVRLPLFEDRAALEARKGVFPIFEAARNDQALLAMQRHVAGQMANSGPVYNLFEHVLRLVYMEISMITNPACVQVTLDPAEDGKILNLLDDRATLEDLRPPAQAPEVQARTVVPPGVNDADRRIAVLAMELGREPTPDEVIDGLGLVESRPMTVASGPSVVRSSRSRALPLLQHYRQVLEAVPAAERSPVVLLSDQENYAGQTREITSGDISIASFVRANGQMPTPETTLFSAGDIHHYRETIRLTGMDNAAIAAIPAPSPSGEPTRSPTRISREIQRHRQERERIRQNQQAQAEREAAERRNAQPEIRGVGALKPVRLAQYSVKPEFLFGMPPACNVIYPSMIDSWALSEDYKSQPTRIYINDSAMTRLMRADGTNRELMLHALTVGYPEEANAVMHHRISTASGAAIPGTHETGRNLLIWPREFYEGPKVARMEISSWFQTLIQWRNNQGQAAPSTPTGGTNTTPGLAPLPGATGPSNIVSSMRQGRVSAPGEYLPDSWVPSANTRAIGDTQHTNYNDTSYEERLGLWNPDDPARKQLPRNRWLEALVDDLVTRFPGHFDSVGFERPSSRRPTRGDIHYVGRAVDLMIRQRGPGPAHVDHSRGDPVAAWLVEHAADIGIQFLVWAGTGWSGNRTPGTKFHAYKRLNPDGTLKDDSQQHRDHIHFDINIAAAEGRTPYFQRRGTDVLRNVHQEQRGRRDVTRGNVQGLGGRARSGPSLGGSLSGLGAARAPESATPTRLVERPTPSSTGVAMPSAGLVTERTTPGVSQELREDVNVAALAGETDPFAKTFYLYAQYEYHKQRYRARNAAVSTRWNPYVVPGYPGVVFDSMKTSFHMVGYVQRVTHSAQIGPPGSMQTNLSFTAVRTFPEFLADVRQDAELFGRRVSSAPAEMIPEIRSIIQSDDTASQFYSRLFYGYRTAPFDQPAAFDFTRAVGMDQGNDGIVPIVMTDETIVRTGEVHPDMGRPLNETAINEANAAIQAQERVVEQARQDGVVDVGRGYRRANTAELAAAEQRLAELRRQRDALVAQQASGASQPYNPQIVQTTSTRVRHNTEPNSEFAPLPTYAGAFESYDTAMRFAARPVCTLQQYIRFYYGGRTIGDLEAAEVLRDAVTTFAYATAQTTDDAAQGDATPRAIERPTALYWRRIGHLRPGPGAPPSPSERGYTDAPVAPTTDTASVSADYPQTRADWEAALLAYADRVRSIRFDR